MRPLELRVRNFRSYAGEHVFSFADRSLVGIVGPIGSGKSSILDAIVFGLYGRTPRIATATKTLINQRAADAAVSLRFEVEGELWEVTRSIRIKGPSRHALYRYEDPDGEPVEKLTLEGEVNEKIVELFGLDYAAFERSVLLAQGRFAEFLQARPADRDRVLKGVFGHDRVDRMKALAKERRDEAELNLERIGVRLQRFDEIAKRLRESTDELAMTRNRYALLAKAAEADSALTERRTAIEKVIESVSNRVEMLDAQAANLPDEDAAARSIADASAATLRRVDLAESFDHAQQQLQTADAALQKANDEGEPALLARAAELLAAADPQRKAVANADRRLSAAQRLLAEAEADQQQAREQLRGAEQTRQKMHEIADVAARALEEAVAALDAGRHADMAATLRSGLEIDEPCPVCDQPVSSIPGRAGDPHLAQLEAEVAAARSARTNADKAYTDVLTALERVRGQAESAGRRVEAATAQLAGEAEDIERARRDLQETNRQLEAILGPGDAAEILAGRKRDYESLVSARDAAQRRTDQARREHDQAIRDEQNTARVLQEIRMRLTELAARLEIEIAVGDDPESLGTALTTFRNTWVESTDGLRNELGDAKRDMEEIDEERVRLLDEAGVTGDPAAAVAVISDRIDRLDKSIAGDEAELAKSGDLTEERAALETRVEVFSRINHDLTDSRFIRFLLDDERARLAELGSEHFQRLSAGRYRFAGDQFDILDLTAADSTRKADSLSGGETFLASLGLALALAEMVAGTGGRLDAFFLDEGFGTLDPEHLDLAMEGIETLIADQSDRLVVIVSHVPELRERIEDLIELERNPVTGDTRVVRE
jgi:DNA repair protein SbcC/Rad50